MQKIQVIALFSPQAPENRLVWQEDDVAQSRIAQNYPDGTAENETFRASTNYMVLNLMNSNIQAIKDIRRLLYFIFSESPRNVF